MNAGKVLTEDEAFESFLHAVRDSDACQELGLCDGDIDRIAFDLFYYQPTAHFERLEKKRRRKKEEERYITATLNSVKEAAERIESMFASGVLFERVMMTYETPESEWLHPREVIPPGRCHLFDTVRETETTHPENQYQSIFETQQRLNSLAKALEKLKVDDSLNPIELDRPNLKRHLVCHIGYLLAPYADRNKPLVADYICDFLKLIDINITHKTILQYLS